MKITEVNLTIPHYVIILSDFGNQCLVTKTELSAVEQGRWDKTKHYLFVKKPICCVNTRLYSLHADLEEEIYQGANYVRFNLKGGDEIDYIAYDLQTVFNLIHKFYLRKYNICRQIPALKYYCEAIKARYKETLTKLKEMK